MSNLLKKNNNLNKLPKKFTNPFFVRDSKKMEKKKELKQKIEGFDPYYHQDTSEITAFSGNSVGLRKVNHNHGIIDDYVDNSMENFDVLTMVKDNLTSKNNKNISYVDFKRDNCIYTANGDYVCNKEIPKIVKNDDIYI